MGTTRLKQFKGIRTVSGWYQPGLVIDEIISFKRKISYAVKNIEAMLSPLV